MISLLGPLISPLGEKEPAQIGTVTILLPGPNPRRRARDFFPLALILAICVFPWAWERAIFPAICWFLTVTK